MDIELELLSESKDKGGGSAPPGSVVARVTVQALTSQPVDQLEANKHLASAEVAGKSFEFTTF